jgi:cob(I)alamin adenosyltransferase
MEKKFVANKAVLVNPEGKILFVCDAGAGDHVGAGGRWDIPGGPMEEIEGPLEGLVREVKEEVGIEIDPKKARPFYVRLWGAGDVRLNPIIGIFYIVQIGKVEVQLSSEHTSYVWHDPRQELPDGAITHAFIQDVLDAYRRTEGIVVVGETKKGREGYGLIQVFTGNGKGKTTAGLGEAIRAVGAGRKVGIVYFDKGGTSHYNERRVLDEFRGRIDYVATGRDRIDPKTGRFDFAIQEIDRTEARRGLEEARKMFKGGYDVVILDEINSTTDLGMLKVEDLLELLKKKPDRLELVMTGRNAPEAFLERADLVTEMKLRKHYFYSGVPAREGLDF